MIDDSDNFLKQSLQQFQRFVRRSGPSAASAYTLLASILLLGSIGFFLDRYLNSPPFYIVIGLFLGILIGFYGLGKTVFKK